MWSWRKRENERKRKGFGGHEETERERVGNIERKKYLIMNKIRCRVLSLI